MLVVEDEGVVRLLVVDVLKELGYYDESFNASLQSSDGDLSSYSFHMADQGTDTM